MKLKGILSEIMKLIPTLPGAGDHEVSQILLLYEIKVEITTFLLNFNVHVCLNHYSYQIFFTTSQNLGLVHL